MNIISNAKNGKKTGDGTGVGLFIPVSGDIAKAFPSLGDKDKSPPHTTFLYIGDITKEQEPLLLATIQKVVEGFRFPVTGHLGELDYFVHPAYEQRVAVTPVRFDADMAGLRWKVRSALIDAGFDVKDSFPLVYKPHVTLEYLQGLDSEYKGVVPKGSWTFDSLEMWGLSKVYSFPTQSVNKVASRYLNAMKHQTSVELIKILSQVARNLGVGNDVYVVGGAVRNFAMDSTGQKFPIKDIDIVVDSQQLGEGASAWFAKEVQKAIPTDTSLVTNQYGVAIITVKNSWVVGGEDLKGEVIEIANTRKESYAEGGYKPEKVEPASIEQDLERREYNFNTLLWRLQDVASGPDLKAILDLTGCGLKDIQEGVMRCPRDPDIVLKDDASRMIRAIKFSIKYGFKIPLDLKNSILRNRQGLRNIPPGHLSNMIINLFYEGGYGKEALLMMKDLGLLDVVKDIAQTNRPFREALGNWAEKRADLKFLFDLMDLGMPVGSSIPRNFTEQQKARLRELSVQLKPEEADDLLETIDQPGRKVDMMSLITEFGLKGGEIQKLTHLAQQILLDQPELLNKPDKLEQEIRKRFGGKTASEHAGKFQEYLDDYSFLFDVMAKEYSARYVGVGNSLISDTVYMLRYTMGKFWAKFIMAGRGLIQAITELKSIPANKAKKFEMAARVFNSIVRIPKDMGKWWEKNEPLFRLVLEAAKWPDKTEADVTQKFQVGPFTVFNTVNLPDAKLREIKDLLEQAIQKIKGLNYPTDFDKVLYGEVFVVGQLSKSNTLAWYVPKDDVFYVRPLMGKRDINVLHNIIHELGHRYWHKFMSTLVKRDWTTYDYQVRNAVRGKVVMPKEGEPVPVLVKTNKGDVRNPIALKVIPGIKYEFNAGDNPFTLGWDRVYKWVLENETAKEFPTRYAMKDPNEHFCEAVASKAVGILKPELEQNFDNVFGKKVVENQPVVPVTEVVEKVATRYLQGATFEFNIGEPIWFGKYKNKSGIIKGFDKDPKGNPLVIIEPVPKGRKQDKALQLFRIWKNHSAVKVANRYLAKWEEKIPGGKAEGKEPKDFDLDALLKGQKVEMEHTDDPQVALEITMDHLTEFDDYYDGLEKMENGLEGKD